MHARFAGDTKSHNVIYGRSIPLFQSGAMNIFFIRKLKEHFFLNYPTRELNPGTHEVHADTGPHEIKIHRMARKIEIN